MRIYGITLWEPWASAVPAGLKRIETRSWPVPPRHPVEQGCLLLIHAAAKCDATVRRFRDQLVLNGAIPHGLKLNFGKVVAATRVLSCDATDRLRVRTFIDQECGPHERMLGDFSPGRFGWMLHKPVLPDEPFAMKGRQKLWRVPDSDPDVLKHFADHELQDLLDKRRRTA